MDQKTGLARQCGQREEGCGGSEGVIYAPTESIRQAWQCYSSDRADSKQTSKQLSKGMTDVKVSGRGSTLFAIVLCCMISINFIKMSTRYGAQSETRYSHERRDIQSWQWSVPMMDKYAKERVCLVPSQQFRGNSPSRFIDGKETLNKMTYYHSRFSIVE